MKKMPYGLMVLLMLVCLATSAPAQVSIGIGLPNVSIGINLPVFPELVPVPGYPVYYAPRMDANYFFYDGMYWVYRNDNWYASSWYNGPWGMVNPNVVPLFVLRIPVRYYRNPPSYFRGWQANAPPRWGQHWGREWEQQRSGWNHWKRGSAPAPAPLPVYQRQYSGDRYPRAEQQRTLRDQQYHYQPRDRIVRQQFGQQAGQKTPAPAARGRNEASPVKGPRPQEVPRPAPRQSGPAAPPAQPPHQGGAVQHEQRAPGMSGPEQRPRERGAAPEPNREQGQGRGGERGR